MARNQRDGSPMTSEGAPTASAVVGRLYDFLRVCRVALPITLIRHGLRDSGWRRSNLAMRPVDRDGNPLPWYTYSAIHLLEERLRPDFRVFEFGAGHSTLWYATRVAAVVAVEDNPEWGAYISSVAPPNVDIVLRTTEDEYVNEITRSDSLFDVIVIDSLKSRVACAAAAIDYLSPRGVVIWDNSDRDDFAHAVHEVKLFPGFKELAMFGIGPCGGIEWTTSILYRDGNCLEI